MAQENHEVNSSASGEVGVDCDGFEIIANLETVERPSIVLNNPDGTEQPLGVPEIVQNPSLLTSDNKEEDERSVTSEESPIQELDRGAAEEVETITLSSDEEQESNDYRPRSSRQYNELLHMTGMAAVAPVLGASVTIDPNNIPVPLTHDQVYSNARADGPLDLRVPNEPLDLSISSVPLDLIVRFEPIDCSVHSLPVVQIVEKEETDSAQDSLINNLEVVLYCKEEPEDIENESSDDDLGSLAPISPPPYKLGNESLAPSPSPENQLNNELEPLAPSPPPTKLDNELESLELSPPSSNKLDNDSLAPSPPPPRLDNALEFLAPTSPQPRKLDNEMGSIVPSVPPANQSDDPQKVISRVMDAAEPRPQRIAEARLVAVDILLNPPRIDVNNGNEVEDLETENPVPNDTPVTSKIRRSSRIAQKIKARENTLEFKTAKQPKIDLKVHQGLVHMDESKCKILAAPITEAAAGTAFVANPSSSSSRILHDPPHHLDRNIVFTPQFRQFFGENFPGYEMEPHVEFEKKLSFLD